ncbi:abortive infection family protein [Flavobacterium sp. 3HN19-14]|uniref:abortive infection family protein n=1 Tax=Flavobacterium sp. 3HN19-14 TaxID=3448133 RepID=UPI003EDFC1BD
MNELISPKYQLKLINSIQAKLHEEFVSYKSILFYLKKWHQSHESYNFNDNWENFSIYLDVNGIVDLEPTLNSMQGEDLLKIAIDLGIDTPDFIPTIPVFKNKIKEKYHNVYEVFSKALKNITTDPSLAIGLTNSAFESIIKEILKDERFSKNLKGTETLYKLVQAILVEFKLDNKEFPQEMKTICSSLIAISQAIEKLRSEKTIFHGKTKDDLLINDSIYVYLTINSFTTVGLFLNSYYKNRYPIPKIEILDDLKDLPF